MKWITLLPFKAETEADLIESFLTDRLKQPHTFTRHKGVIKIESPSRDEAFKVGTWIHHNNTVGRKLFYVVVGYDGNEHVIFRSLCERCMEEDTPHAQHI